jgi:hypothetical protein
MNIEQIRRRIKRGNYLVKSHAVQHALKEGFDRKHMVEALLNGEIIEEYPDEKRVLVCGQVILGKGKKSICMWSVNTPILCTLNL